MNPFKCARCGKEHIGECSDVTELQARIVTLESDNAELTKERVAVFNEGLQSIRKLAAAQATIAKLRDAVEGAYDYVEEAIQSYVQCYGEKFRPERLQYIRSVKASCDEALALPLDTTALQERLRQAKVEVLREAADRLMNCGEEFGAKHLHIMADEIEKGERE